MHPLKPPTDRLVNISNGLVADGKVNVQNAVIIGQNMAARFQEQNPEGFYGSDTMETLKKGVKVGDKMVYGTDKLFSCMLVTSVHRGLYLNDVLSYELGPLPFSLCDDYGDL